jgi:hypothetical protein
MKQKLAFSGQCILVVALVHENEKLLLTCLIAVHAIVSVEAREHSAELGLSESATPVPNTGGYEVTRSQLPHSAFPGWVSMHVRAALQRKPLRCNRRSSDSSGIGHYTTATNPSEPHVLRHPQYWSIAYFLALLLGRRYRHQ